MKTDIHPQYFPKAKVTCNCGETFTVGSTMEKINVEICSNCHPFYTGEQKVLDTAGRVEKFKTRATKKTEVVKKKKVKIRKGVTAVKKTAPEKKKPEKKKAPAKKTEAKADDK